MTQGPVPGKLLSYILSGGYFESEIIFSSCYSILGRSGIHILMFKLPQLGQWEFL